jgi:ankyrin repeat protein
MDRSPAPLKLITGCWLGDEALVESIRRGQETFTFSSAEKRQIAHAAYKNDLSAVKLMLGAGLPVGARSRHNATALHWAAWHGNVAIVRLVLQHDPPLEDASNDFKSTPLGWAIHGSENGWHREQGNYPATVEALLKAGARPPDKIGGSEDVQAVLRGHRRK